MDRRRALQLLAGSAAGALVPPRMLPGQRKPPAVPRRPVLVPDDTLTLADDAFLEELTQSGCRYFIEQADPNSGQVLDRARANNKNGAMDGRRLSSVAATGFGLTALCIAHKRGYAAADAIERRVQRTLNFHAHRMKHEYGFFCHFNDVRTGVPFPNVEYSSIDTCLLLCGVLTAKAYFPGNPSIAADAKLLYERVEWPWMIFGGTDLFCMGWELGKGFLQAVWNHYCELMMLPLLAMGSPTNPVPPDVWSAWSRPTVDYKGLRYIASRDPLFVHQYSHAWFDFRGKRDDFANYFQNSVTATRANRLFCLDWGAPYSPEYWGISASDSEHGYRAWGGPPAFGGVNGTVVPAAAAGSLPFTPGVCLQTLRAMREQYGSQAWGRYGFCDAFHPDNEWYDDDVLGIDIGIGVVMAENLRTGLIWETFAKNPEVGRAMELAGFHSESPLALRQG